MSRSRMVHVMKIYCENCQHTHKFSPRELAQLVYYHQALLLDHDTPLGRCLLGIWNEAKKHEEVREYTKTYGTELLFA